MHEPVVVTDPATLNRTTTPAIGCPRSVTVAVTVWLVPTSFVAATGSSAIAVADGRQIEMKTSVVLFVSPGTRFDAWDAKATTRPSPLIAALKLSAFGSMPEPGTFTRVVAPVSRSRTKTSFVPFVSPRRGSTPPTERRRSGRGR